MTTVKTLKIVDLNAQPLSEVAGYKKAAKYVELDIILAEVVQSLRDEITELKDDVKALKKTNKELNERVSKLETNNASGGGTSGQPLFSSLFSGKSTEAEVQILAKVHREFYQKKTNESNIIVSGLPAAIGGTEEERIKNDRAILDPLMQVLGNHGDNIRKHRRIETNGKPSLVIVEFKDPDEVPYVLKGAKNLRVNDIYKRVYVNRDMTRTERLIQKQLRDDRNKRNNEDLKETGNGKWPRGTHGGKLFHWGI